MRRAEALPTCQRQDLETQRSSVSTLLRAAHKEVPNHPWPNSPQRILIPGRPCPGGRNATEDQEASEWMGLAGFLHLLMLGHALLSNPSTTWMAIFAKFKHIIRQYFPSPQIFMSEGSEGS